MERSNLPLVAGALSVAACGFTPTGDAPALADRLAARAHLSVTADSTVDATALARGRAEPIAPPVIGGQVVVRTTADGYLLVEDLTLALGDVTLPAGMLGEAPVRFTDLALTLGTQLAVPVADAPDAAALVGTGRADLVLDWALVDADGRLLPLGLRRAPRVPFTVAVTADADGTLRADLASRIDGTAVTIDGTAAIRDVALTVASRGSM